MSNPSVQQFYAVAHEGNFFHEKGPMYGPLGHLGQDYHDWAKGTIIPSWTAGTVAFVSKQPSPTLGYLVIVRRSDGRYAGFCHLNAPSKLALGQHVDVGTPIGPLGMTGSLATGYHLHATLEPQLTIGTPNAEDPLPYIHATLAGLAGGDVKPLPNSPLISPSNKEDSMLIAYIPNGAPNKKDHLFLLFSEHFYLEFVGQPAANEFVKQIGGGKCAPVDRSFFNATKAAVLAFGGSVSAVA